MAKNSGKGNFLHGNSGRHGSERASEPPESMWTNPVARITPAANALAPLISPPVDGRRVPTRGRETPNAPATSMDAIAAYLRVRAAASSRHGSDSPESQLVVNDSVHKNKKK